MVCGRKMPGLLGLSYQYGGKREQPLVWDTEVHPLDGAARKFTPVLMKMLSKFSREILLQNDSYMDHLQSQFDSARSLHVKGAVQAALRMHGVDNPESFVSAMSQTSEVNSRMVKFDLQMMECLSPLHRSHFGHCRKETSGVRGYKPQTSAVRIIVAALGEAWTAPNQASRAYCSFAKTPRIRCADKEARGCLKGCFAKRDSDDIYSADFT